MERRDFLKVAGAAGLSVVSPVALGQRTLGHKKASLEAPYAGPFYVSVNASGGWDPTHLCDPKGAKSLMDADRLTNYLETDIGTAGPIRFAPVGANAAFFTKYASRLLVINGIDCKTNGHDAGSRHTWSGHLSEGHPSFAAFVAAANGPELPISYLSFGGYDLTSGVVARTRSGNIGALARLAYPERVNPDDEATYHSAKALELLRKAQLDREGSLRAAEGLPRVQRAMNTLFTSRVGSNELKKLQQFLPRQLDQSGNPINRQAQVALAAYRAGISVAASLNLGGFDTHGNHDQQHIPALQTLLQGIDFLMSQAESMGIGDQIVLVVGSDFGRTPGYNDQDGKDHWSVTSMMLMGPGIQGNRVVGASDDGHRPLKVNPQTLDVDDNGIHIEPGHVHGALRRLAKLDTSELAASFPLSVDEDLPLLG